MVRKRARMVELPSQLLLAVRSRFTRRTRLEDEDLLLRQQLAALRRKLYGPSPPTTVPRLEDFLLFIRTRLDLPGIWVETLTVEQVLAESRIS